MNGHEIQPQPQPQYPNPPVAQMPPRFPAGQPQPMAQAPINIVVQNSVGAQGAGLARIANRKKSIALLACFFFGWLGIHRFYLGQTAMGLVYLFTWGLFGFGVLIDFFVIAFKPEREFDMQYNVGIGLPAA